MKRVATSSVRASEVLPSVVIRLLSWVSSSVGLVCQRGAPKSAAGRGRYRDSPRRPPGTVPTCSGHEHQLPGGRRLLEHLVGPPGLRERDTLRHDRADLALTKELDQH